MMGTPTPIGHRAAAIVHIATAAHHYERAAERLGAAESGEAAYHAQIACDNLVFALHHAREADGEARREPRKAGAPMGLGFAGGHLVCVTTSVEGDPGRVVKIADDRLG